MDQKNRTILVIAIAITVLAAVFVSLGSLSTAETLLSIRILIFAQRKSPRSVHGFIP